MSFAAIRFACSNRLLTPLQLRVTPRTQSLATLVGVALAFAFSAAVCRAQVTRTWIAGGTQNVWSNSANWTPPGVPGASDTAIVPVGKFVKVESDVAVATLTLQGVLQGTGNVTITGHLSWDGGTMSGPGKTILATGATGSITGPAATMNANREFRNSGVLSIAAPMTMWYPAAFTNLAEGTLTITTDAALFGDAFRMSPNSNPGPIYLTNAGLITKESASRSIIGNGINFRNTGAIEVRAGALQFSTSNAGTNSGTFRVEPDAILDLRDPLTFTAGAIDADGELHFIGTTISFPPGSFGAKGKTLFRGVITIQEPWAPKDGLLRLETGTFTANAPLTVTRLESVDCNVVLGTPMEIGEIAMLGGGSLSLNGNTTIKNLTATKGYGLFGTGKLTVTDSCLLGASSFNIGGNTVLTLGPACASSVPDGIGIGLLGTIENFGTMSLRGVISINSSGTSLFVNRPGGVVNIDSNSDKMASAFTGYSGTVTNQGVMNKVGTTRTQFGETSSTGVVFHNAGVVNVLEGRLDFFIDGTDSGITNVAPGAIHAIQRSRTQIAGSGMGGTGTLRIESHPYYTSIAPTLNYPPGGWTFAGSLLVSKGNLTINDPFAPALLSITGGTVAFNQTLSYTSDFTITGAASVSFGVTQTFSKLNVYGVMSGAGAVSVSDTLVFSGTMSGTGKTTLGPGGTATIVNCSLIGRTLENAGTVQFTGTMTMSGNARFSNLPSGLAVVSTNYPTAGYVFGWNDGNPGIVNAGTFRKVTNSTTNVHSMVWFSNTGKIEVQAGKLSLYSISGNLGDVSVSPGASLSLSGVYTIDKPLTLSSGSSLSLSGSWENKSAITGNGISLILAGSWTNSGTFDISNSSWSIGGDFDSLGPTMGSGNTYTYTGAFYGTTLKADLSTGDVYLQAGYLDSVVLAASQGARFIVNGSNPVAAYGTSLEGEMVITSCGSLVIGSDFTLRDGAILRVNNAGCQRDSIEFRGTGTLGGTGTIEINEGGSRNALYVNGAYLTVDPGVTIRLRSNSATTSNATISLDGKIFNHGTFSSEQSGRTLSIIGYGKFENLGTVQAIAGTLNLNPGVLLNYDTFTRNLSGGKWRAAGGSLSLGGRNIRSIGAGTEIDIEHQPASAPDLSELTASAGTLRLSGTHLSITPVGGVLGLSGTTQFGPGSRLSVQGGVAMSAGSSTRFLASGIQPDAYGQLASSGSIELGGKLNGALLAPFQPHAGDVLADVITAAQTTGAFLSTCFDTNDAQLGVRAIIENDRVSLALTPDSGTTPQITQQPQDVNARGSAQFRVLASPLDATFQWRKDSTPLVDGPTAWGSIVGGSTSPYLTLSSVSQLDAGRYDVVITNSCGGTTSTAALLELCPGDIDINGVVDDQDFVGFLHDYSRLQCTSDQMLPGCPADLNSDGVVDDADFGIFVVAYDLLLCP